MIRYNWAAVNRAGNSDPLTVVALFKDILRKTPSAKAIKCFSVEPKDSYLRNPGDLLRNRIGASPLELYHYIRLASLRNPADYGFVKDASLHKSLVDICVDNFITIKQDNNYITFKYEE